MEYETKERERESWSAKVHQMLDRIFRFPYMVETAPDIRLHILDVRSEEYLWGAHSLFGGQEAKRTIYTPKKRLSTT